MNMSHRVLSPARVGSIRQLACCLVLCGFSGMAGLTRANVATESWDARLAGLQQQTENHPDEAVAEALALESRLQSAGEPQRRQFYRQLCHIASLARDQQLAERAAAWLERASPGTSDSGTLADAGACRAESEFERGQRLLAFREAQKAADAAKDAKDPGARYYAGLTLGHIGDGAAEFAGAAAGYAMAETAAEALGKPADVVRVTAYLARLYHRVNQDEHAAATIELAINRAHELNDAGLLALVYSTKYYCLPDDASPESAVALRQALKYAQESGNTTQQLVMQANLSDYLLDTRDYREAIRAANEALRMGAGLPSSPRREGARAIALANRGFARLALGDPGAHKDVELAVTLLSIDNKPDASRVYRDYANALAESGDFRGAWTAMQNYQRISDELFKSDQQNRVLQLREMLAADKLERENAALRGESALKSVERRVSWLASIVAVLVALLALMSYRRLMAAHRVLRTRHREADFKSRHDALTGLLNRRAFADYIEDQRAAEAPGYQRRDQALVMLDVDRFKLVNDTYGHEAGDEVLKATSRRLSAAVRDSDLVVRWGGEEFLVFLPTPHEGSIEVVVERLLQAVGGTPISIGGRDITVTVSAGFLRLPVTAGAEELPWERLLHLADLLLYEAKSCGRNRAMGLVERTGISSATELQAIENDLRAAIRQRRLQVRDIPGPCGRTPLALLEQGSADPGWRCGEAHSNPTGHRDGCPWCVDERGTARSAF
jgi:diguanylate cyclase (GGDEF)-like protein